MNATCVGLLDLGKKVKLTENWSPPGRAKLVFPKGTEGEIIALFLQRGEVEIEMRFPHSPTMVEVIPMRVLGWA